MTFQSARQHGPHPLHCRRSRTRSQNQPAAADFVSLRIRRGTPTSGRPATPRHGSWNHTGPSWFQLRRLRSRVIESRIDLRHQLLFSE